MKRLRLVTAFTVSFTLAAAAGLDTSQPGHDLAGALIFGLLGASLVHVWFAPIIMQRERDLEIARAAYQRFSTVWCPADELDEHLNELIDDVDSGEVIK